jgi:hypothetical protein
MEVYKNRLCLSNILQIKHARHHHLCKIVKKSKKSLKHNCFTSLISFFALGFNDFYLVISEDF